MALRAGRKDPVLQIWSEQELLDASGWKAEPRADWMDGQEWLRPSLAR